MKDILFLYSLTLATELDEVELILSPFKKEIKGSNFENSGYQNSHIIGSKQNPYQIIVVDKKHFSYKK